jgi:hypothetical protein
VGSRAATERHDSASASSRRAPSSRSRRRDYAVLTALWGGASALLVRAERRQGAAAAPARPAELPVLALATFAVARTVSRERVESWLREPFVDERDGRQQPRGDGARHAIGELLACTRCTGTWAALGVTAGWVLAPRGGRALVTALAAAGANDFLQAAFSRAAQAEAAEPAVTKPS